jgi:hypothetical protein
MPDSIYWFYTDAKGVVLDSVSTALVGYAIIYHEAVAEWILHFVQNDKTAGLCHSEGAKRPKNPSYSYHGRSATRS